MGALYQLKKIQIEVVNLCNFRCPLCPTTVKNHVVRRRMSCDEFKKVMGPILSELEEVIFFGTKGEPLLNPELEEMIAYTKEHSSKVHTGISSNGSLLTPERSLALMQAGLDKLVVGIDGLSDESFSHYRVGGKLDVILENLKAACEIKKEHNFATQIVWQFIPMKKNEDEMKKLEEFAFNLGVDVVSVKLSRSVAESDEYKTSDSQFVPEFVNQDHFTCPSGTDKLYIDPNGDVFPCCFAEGAPQMKAGNALETSVENIWQSNFMTELRSSFEKQRPWSYCEKECRGICHKEKVNIKKHKYPKKKLADTFNLS